MLAARERILKISNYGGDLGLDTIQVRVRSAFKVSNHG
jgi:hypothetical protein